MVGSDDRPRSTKLELTLNTDAQVEVVLKRTKKVHGKAVKAALTKSLGSGKASITLTSKVGAKKLPPGTYRIKVRATNAVRASATKTVTLKILR